MDAAAWDPVEPMFMSAAPEGYRIVYSDGAWRWIAYADAVVAARRLRLDVVAGAKALARACKRLEISRESCSIPA